MQLIVLGSFYALIDVLMNVANFIRHNFDFEIMYKENKEQEKNVCKQSSVESVCVLYWYIGNDGKCYRMFEN